jgi:hypothetical protein
LKELYKEFQQIVPSSASPVCCVAPRLMGQLRTPNESGSLTLVPQQ